MLARVRDLGEWFGNELERLRTRVPAIIDVRGMGMMWGIELDRPAKDVARALLENGFIVGTARDNVIRLLPPYIVPRKALRQFVQTFERLLTNSPTAVDSRLSSPARPLTTDHRQTLEGALSK